MVYGYNDGYWDRAHAWHAWLNPTAERDYRERNTAHYFAWKHDRDKDMGWHEDHWWDHHAKIQSCDGRAPLRRGSSFFAIFGNSISVISRISST